MLYRDKEGLKLSNMKVRFMQNGKEKEKFVGNEGEQWWIDFADKWERTEIIEFINVSYTGEQLERFKKVKDIIADEDELRQYIETGNINSNNEKLKVLFLEKENEDLKQTLADLAETVLMGGM